MSLQGAELKDDVLGIYIDGVNKVVRLSDRRFGKMKGALRWALAVGCLSGSQLEVLVGHLIF